MTSTQRGGLAGAIGGVIVAAAFFVDYGPGASLHQVARWFAVDFGAAGLALGAVILVLLGALFGALFGRAVARWGTVTLGRAELVGVVAGIVWWVIVPMLFGSVVRQQPVSVYGMLLFLALALLYGVVLGNVFVTLQERAG